MTTLLDQRKTLDRLYAAGAMDEEEFHKACTELAETIIDAELAEDISDDPPRQDWPDLRPAALSAAGAAFVLFVIGTPLAFALPVGLAVAVGVLMRDTFSPSVDLAESEQEDRATT